MKISKGEYKPSKYINNKELGIRCPVCCRYGSFTPSETQMVEIRNEYYRLQQTREMITRDIKYSWSLLHSIQKEIQEAEKYHNFIIKQIEHLPKEIETIQKSMSQYG